MTTHDTGLIVVQLVLYGVALVATVVWLVGEIREAVRLRRLHRALRDARVRTVPPRVAVRLVWKNGTRLEGGG